MKLNVQTIGKHGCKPNSEAALSIFTEEHKMLRTSDKTTEGSSNKIFNVLLGGGGDAE
jgi:hypothetical protein